MCVSSTYQVRSYLLWTNQYLHKEEEEVVMLTNMWWCNERGARLTRHRGCVCCSKRRVLGGSEPTKWKNGTSRNTTNDDVWAVIRDHQRRSTNLLALVSKYCTYLSLPASLGLFARCSPSGGGGIFIYGLSPSLETISRIRNLTLESNWLVQMIQREIENCQVACSWRQTHIICGNTHIQGMKRMIRDPNSRWRKMFTNL